MNPKFELKQERKQSLTQKQSQRLIMSAKMQQGIYFLQLPIQELEATIEEELEENPLLDILEDQESSSDEEEEWESETRDSVEDELSFKEGDFEALNRMDDDFAEDLYQEKISSESRGEGDKIKTFLLSLVQKRDTLFENLMRQAEEAFATEDEMKAAESVIGSLDEKGFLTTPLDEIAFLSGKTPELVDYVIRRIQEFDPPGIAATSLKESLLLQLKRKGKDNTLAFKIIEGFFDELVQNKIKLIAVKLKESPETIKQTVKDHIVQLDLNPGYLFADTGQKHIVPDLSIQEEEGVLKVKANNDRLPELKINRQYIRLLQDESLNKGEKEFLKNKIESARWLIKNIAQRQSTIERIGEWLADKQKSFFLDPKGLLTPACMRELADDLSLHESTIARAIANKYLSCDRGVFPLRKFFTASYTNVSGEAVSAKTVKDILKEIIDGEDKKRPLSDLNIEKELEKRGIPCARRTISKYRLELNIGNVHQRREF